jgi:hypothetical protein
MLRILQNSASASAKSYYAHSDYLNAGQELIGRWGGRTAQKLGLTGDVVKLSFDRRCNNLDPRSGEQLTLRTNGDRTIGDDFNDSTSICRKVSRWFICWVRMNGSSTPLA